MGATQNRDANFGGAPYAGKDVWVFNLSITARFKAGALGRAVGVERPERWRRVPVGGRVGDAGRGRRLGGVAATHRSRGQRLRGGRARTGRRRGAAADGPASSDSPLDPERITRGLDRNAGPARVMQIFLLV
ncbi:hypothetical protein Areg01_12110 [Actinoplanes regularis]|nr:hypothetical protein Areg01_12110 [Actinoplanes regularis]